MTSRIFIYKMFVSFATVAGLLAFGLLVLHIAGVFGRVPWTLLCFAIIVAAALTVEDLFERVALNRVLDRSPRLPCPRCGYSLDSHLEQWAAPVCPECGTKTTEMTP